jgi:curved DNA-binding protein CbpA
MGIFDRLGTVINSHFNDFADQTNSRFKYNRSDFNRSDYNRNSRNDPDLDAAYEELNDFLNNKEPRVKSTKGHDAQTSKKKLPPESLRSDFETLGVPFGSDEETCKAAYKKMLKTHHPDRHTNHEGNYKKATAKSAKLNAAWDRIEKWLAS